MANVIGHAHKTGKKNRKQLKISTYSSSAPSYPLNSHKCFSENTDITSKSDKIQRPILLQPLL